MSLALLSTLKAIDEARDRLDVLANTLEHELAAAYSALDACRDALAAEKTAVGFLERELTSVYAQHNECRSALAAERTATASWRARCLDADRALVNRTPLVVRAVDTEAP